MMQAGKYFIGDLCYVMTDDEWEEFCDLTLKGVNIIDGEFQFKDGRKFASYSTKYGDGTYYDQHGYSYSVDAGLIGCIKIEDIRADKYDNLLDLGAIEEFGTDFVTGGGRNFPDWEGTIQFGHIAIETAGQYEDEEY
jgi:hypothetical protein